MGIKRYGYLGGAKQHWWWPAAGALMGPLSGNVTQALTYNLGNQSGSWLKVGRMTGQKHYELSDHLGNVLATVLDRRTGSENVHNETVNPLYPAIPVHDDVSADVSSVSDYYPGGMPMKERTWVPSLTSKYKFGYQQQQKDDELYGDGMSYAYKYRMEDVRLNRFWSVDPLASQYPHNSSYAYSENRLIDGVELEGLEYATFHIYVDFKTGNVTNIQVVRDYELKNKNTQGPGIKYVYHDSYNNKEVPALAKFVKNIYGIYQGGDNPKLPQDDKGNYLKYTDNRDNYDLVPIDETDANAKQHDLDYDKKSIAGLGGILSKKSTKANEDYINRADKTIDKGAKGEKDNITGKPVTKAAVDVAKFGKKWFKVSENLKRERKDERTPEQKRMDAGPKY